MLDPVGLTGGLAMLWHDNIVIHIERVSQHFFDTTCTDTRLGTPMRLTCVHAPATYQSRQQLWTDLCLIALSNILPWVCAGDFNEVLFPWENVGQWVPEPHRMHSFRDVLHDCSLMDMDSKGCAFTLRLRSMLFLLWALIIALFY